MANSKLNLTQVVGKFLQGKGQATYAELRDAYHAALMPLPWKEVSWEVIRNIANTLTNGVENLPNVNLEMAHFESGTSTASREFILDLEHYSTTSTAIFYPNKDGGWYAMFASDLVTARWRSITSGNLLEAKRIENGKWHLRYLPSIKDPEHRGMYFRFYDKPEEVTNVTLKKVGAIMPPLSN